MKITLKGKTPVAPLPVLIVATYNDDGSTDAMNVAWGGQSGASNVTLHLSKNHRTTANLLKREAFTLSLATVDTLVMSDFFGITSGAKTDKITKAGVSVSRADEVDAPVIDAYPFTMECRVMQITDFEGEARVDAEIVRTHVDDSMLDEEGNIDFGKMRLISFDSQMNLYREVGAAVGKAFHDGRKLM